MGEKSQIKIGIVLNYINIFLGNLIPIFYTPIMLELLGKSEYGLYKLSSSVTSYLSLMSLGIGSAVTRYLIKYRLEQGQESEESIFGLFIIIFQVIAFLTFLIGVVLVFNLDIWYSTSLNAEQLYRMKIIVFLMICNMVISFSVSPYLSVVNAHEKFIFLQFMNIITTCVGPIMNLVILWLGYASIGMAFSTLIMNLIIQLVYLIYVRKSLKIKPRYKNLKLDLLKEILTFSFWIFVANVITQLYNATDTVMIGSIASLATEGVAVYNIGATFNSIMLSMSTGISNILAPKANKMIFSNASNEQLTDFVIKIGRIQSYIVSLILTGFVAFGQPFINFYVGVGYEESYWIAILMMIPNMIPLTQSACLNIIIAQNKHRFRSLVYLGIAILNVIGTWFMMKCMGIIGAALMTGIALFIGTGLIMNWYYDKKSGLNMIRFWKEIGKIYLLPFCMCFLILFISRFVNFYNLKILLMSILIYTLVFCIVQWLFIFNEYEKDLLRKPLKKLILKMKI